MTQTSPAPSEADTNRLAIFADAPIVSLLQATLGPSAGCALAVLDALDKAGPADRVLILYPGPVPTMAAALVAGGTVQAVLADWSARAGAIMGFVRRNRRRVMLLEDSAFLANPAPVLARLRLPPSEALPTPVAPTSPAPDAMLLLLAGEMLRRNPAASALASELAASATLGPDATSAADLEAALHRYQAVVDSSARLTDELSESTSEHEAVLQRLMLTQAEHADLTARLHERDQGLQSTEALLREQAAELAGETDRRKALEAEKDGLETALALLKLDLAERTEVLEASTREAARLRETVTLRDGEIAALAARTEALKVSTDEARVLRETLTRHAAQIAGMTEGLAESKAEQESVLRQLFDTQAERKQLQARVHQLDQGLQSTEVQLREQAAELARQTDWRKALEAEKAALEATLAQLRLGLAERDSALAARTADLEASAREAAVLRNGLVQRDTDIGTLTGQLVKVERDLAARKRELEKLLTSTSYRITAPMRWIKLKLGGKG